MLAEQRGINVETSLPRDLPLVNADIALMERVFQNLLDNALQYTPDNGAIRISLSAAKGNINVNVADTGCGIPEGELPHIFERYHRASDSLPPNDTGAGLGLAIVKKILELHNVSISVASRVQEGTSFTFDLPATPTEYQSTP